MTEQLVEPSTGASSASTTLPAENNVAIEVHDLVKRYAKTNFNAVDGISFQVRRGEIFGLLGPNGAGKTTTIGVLTTSILPTSGSARIMGVDVVADPMSVKQRIAVVPQRVNLDQSLRVREILTFHAAYHGIPRAEREVRADALLEELGLGGRGKQKIGWFSGGMGQRVMLARALMHEPDVLFLDEPTNNLDPQSRLFLWDRIRALQARGVTIVLTTHDMEEADQLCERIAIMDHGHILVLDTSPELKKLVPGGTCLDLRVHLPVPAATTATTSPASQPVLDALRTLPGSFKVEEVPAGEGDEQGMTTFRLYAQDAGTLIIGATQAILSTGAQLRDMHLARPSLEDVFIHLTGRNLRS